MTSPDTEALKTLVELAHECESAKVVSGRFQTKEEYTAEHRLNVAIRNAIPALERLLASQGKPEAEAVCPRCKQLRKAYGLANYHLSVALEVIAKQLKDRTE